MCGQVTRAILTGLLGGLELAGCSSGGKSKVDGPPVQVSDAGSQPDVPFIMQAEAGTSTQPDGDDTDDAGCDEDAHTEDWCIKNWWPPNVGGGTPVTRQEPVDYNTCKSR